HRSQCDRRGRGDACLGVHRGSGTGPARGLLAIDPDRRLRRRLLRVRPTILPTQGSEEWPIVDDALHLRDLAPAPCGRGDRGGGGARTGGGWRAWSSPAAVGGGAAGPRAAWPPGPPPLKQPPPRRSPPP